MTARGNFDRELLMPRDVAMLFGVEPRTITKWVRQGKLVPVRTGGGHRRYHRDHVIACLKEVEENGKLSDKRRVATVDGKPTIIDDELCSSPEGESRVQQVRGTGDHSSGSEELHGGGSAGPAPDGLSSGSADRTVVEVDFHAGGGGPGGAAGPGGRSDRDRSPRGGTTWGE